MKSILKTATAIALTLTYSGQAISQDMLQALGAGEVR